VGIVFAPTLNIPAWLISLFLTDYSAIFGLAVDDEKVAMKEVTTAAQAPPEAIRSSKQQNFTDIPTTVYNQQNMQSMSSFQPLSGQGRAHRSTFMPPTNQSQTNLHQSYSGPPPNYHQSYHSAMHQNMYSMPVSNTPESYTYGPPANMMPSPQQQQPVQQQHPVQPMSNTFNLSVPDTRRNRRESAMMGMEIGLIGQRHSGRMTTSVNSGSSTPQPAYS
jgi:RalA-binding protein 1